MGFAKKIPLNMAPKLAGNSTILFRGAEATLLNPLPPPHFPPPGSPPPTGLVAQLVCIVRCSCICQTKVTRVLCLGGRSCFPCCVRDSRGCTQVRHTSVRNDGQPWSGATLTVRLGRRRISCVSLTESERFFIVWRWIAPVLHSFM